MKIKFNSEVLETNSKTLEEFILEQKIKLEAFALVKNGAVIPKSSFKSEPICDGDEIEIFTLMAGA